MRRLIPLIGERLRLRLWIVPVAFALSAAIGALVVIWIDARSESLPLTLGIDSESARSLLSAISSAMISFTALVFSVTMLVLQLAASQLSPRVMRTFLRDRFNQTVLGLFVATFVFTLLLLASITPDAVPQLGTLVSIILVLVSVLAFVAYIDHMAHAVGPSDVIDSIAGETRRSIERIYPQDPEDDEAGDDEGEGREGALPEVVREVASPHRSGYIVAVDEWALAKAARAGDHVIEVLFGPGSFVVHGEALLVVRGGASGPELEKAADAVTVDSERTMSQDPGFGFRQLIDIALKALSPSMNDQTTADRVIDQLHDLLRLLRDRPLPSPRRITEDGRLRVLVPGIDWDAFVTAAVAEIGHASRDQPFVREHLRRTAMALLADAGPDRSRGLRRALALLEEEHPAAQGGYSDLS